MGVHRTRPGVWAEREESVQRWACGLRVTAIVPAKARLILQLASSERTTSAEYKQLLLSFYFILLFDFRRLSWKLLNRAIILYSIEALEVGHLASTPSVAAGARMYDTPSHYEGCFRFPVSQSNMDYASLAAGMLLCIPLNLGRFGATLLYYTLTSMSKVSGVLLIVARSYGCPGLLQKRQCSRTHCTQKRIQ